MFRTSNKYQNDFGYVYVDGVKKYRIVNPVYIELDAECQISYAVTGPTPVPVFPEERYTIGAIEASDLNSPIKFCEGR